MILSDTDIKKAIKDGDLVITPPPPEAHFSPTAVDLRVGTDFKVWRKFPKGVTPTFNLSVVRITECGELAETVQADRNGLIAVPKDDFLLVPTLERVELPLAGGLAARVEGRSSFARLGLAVHITAPIVHAGFEGTIVLEIKNLGPFTLMIEPGVTPICQMVFEKVSSPPTGPLITDFQDQCDVFGGACDKDST